MAFTFYSLLEATLLCLNAVCILHEERFLAKSMIVNIDCLIALMTTVRGSLQKVQGHRAVVNVVDDSNSECTDSQLNAEH